MIHRKVRSLALLGGFLGAAWIVGNSIADGPTDKKEPVAKKEHLTPTALRDRIMTEFHGRTANVFTSVPGFGMERMIPVYERIPWEVPHFSTNDVEVEQSPATPKLLKDIFAKSLAAFEQREAAKKNGNDSKDKDKASGGLEGAGKAQRAFVFEEIRNTKGVGGVQGDTIVGGVQLRVIDLIGALDPARPKIYSGGKAFELVRSKRGFGEPTIAAGKKADAKADQKKADNPHFGEAEDRPLDLFESIGLNELIDGKETFVRNKDNVIRMLGALRAGASCIECHTDHKQGDLLGAFAYTFLDTTGTLTKGGAAAGQQPPARQ